MIRQRAVPQHRRGQLRPRLLPGQARAARLSAWGGPGPRSTRAINGPYEAAVHFSFESLEAMMQRRWAFRRHGRDLMADMANYTTIIPTQQISEIVD